MVIRRLAAKLACAAVLGLGAGPGIAHPHVFVDAGLHLHFDDEGRLAAIRVVWAYDAFYTLLLLEDEGLDPDMTGSLTESEKEALARLDTTWIEGFEGDLFVYLGQDRLALSGPREAWAELQDGRAVTSHLRVLAEPTVIPDGGVLELRVYDPDFYTAYAVSLPTRLEGAGSCTAARREADLERAYAELEARLADIPEDQLESDFPQVGHVFADVVEVRCTPGA